MYMALKHTHLLLATTTIIFFWIRVFMKINSSNLLTRRFVKIAPHVIDTLLLIIGIILAVQLGLRPSAHPWLMAKLIALVGYIGLGILTLKTAKTNASTLTMALVATVVFIYIVGLAVTKQISLGLF